MFCLFAGDMVKNVQKNLSEFFGFSTLRTHISGLERFENVIFIFSHLANIINSLKRQTQFLLSHEREKKFFGKNRFFLKKTRFFESLTLHNLRQKFFKILKLSHFP